MLQESARVSIDDRECEQQVKRIEERPVILDEHAITQPDALQQRAQRFRHVVADPGVDMVTRHRLPKHRGVQEHQIGLRIGKAGVRADAAVDRRQAVFRAGAERREDARIEHVAIVIEQPEACRIAFEQQRDDVAMHEARRRQGRQRAGSEGATALRDESPLPRRRTVEEQYDPQAVRQQRQARQQEVQRSGHDDYVEPVAVERIRDMPQPLKIDGVEQRAIHAPRDVSVTADERDPRQHQQHRRQQAVAAHAHPAHERSHAPGVIRKRIHASGSRSAIGPRRGATRVNRR